MSPSRDARRPGGSRWKNTTCLFLDTAREGCHSLGVGNRFLTFAGRATISDVADAAGVSKATVSKFLSGNSTYHIAEQTRGRIGKAIKDLEFQPNAIARQLSLRRSNSIGVIVASIVNPFYPELIAGIEDVVGPSDYTVLLGSTEDRPMQETDLVRSMMQRQVDGLIMASVTLANREVAQLVDSGVDVVLASRGLDQALVDTVEVDNEVGARLAAEHLLAHGHRRVAHLAGPQDIVPFRLRRGGYEWALGAAGLPVDPALVVTSGGSAGALASAMRQLLDLPAPPTALFVASDRRAIEVLEFCAASGVGVPGDLAVVGFDNVWVGRLPGVGLTTVNSRARQVGQKAAGILLKRLQVRHTGAKGGQTGPQITTLDPELVVRHTCGCTTT